MFWHSRYLYEYKYLTVLDPLVESSYLLDTNLVNWIYLSLLTYLAYEIVFQNYFQNHYDFWDHSPHPRDLH